MHQHERHLRIVEKARSSTRVEVTSLAEELNVTPETIRRDLTILERHGHLRRVHGGAIAVERLGFEPTTAMRAERNTTQKLAIAAAAISMVPQGGTIILDAGTTTLALAERLPAGGELTVVTNSLPIATALDNRDDLRLYLLGGRVRTRTHAAVGDWAISGLRGIHADVTFLGTNGLSVREGLTTPDQSEALTKAAMVATAQRVVVLADHSKVGVAHFARFAQLSDVDTIVTDDGLDAETVADLTAHGPEVVLA